MEADKDNSNNVISPIQEIPNSNTKAEAIWKEQIAGLRFFHGTSEAAAEEIKKNGLSQQDKPYNSEEHDYLRNLITKLGLEDSYLANKELSVYITASLSRACSYAISGPEMLRIFYLGNCDAILQAWKLGTAQKAGMTEADFEKIKKIKHSTVEFLNNHRPVLFEITKDSNALKKILKNVLSEKYFLLDEKEEFLNEVLKMTSENKQLTAEQAAEILRNNITAKLNNLAIHEVIPPEDLTEFKNEEFFKLTNETKNMKRIIDTCLFDIKEHPYELLKALDLYINYDEGGFESIKHIGEYYRLDSSSINKIFNRAKIFRNQKNKKVNRRT